MTTNNESADLSFAQMAREMEEGARQALRGGAPAPDPASEEKRRAFWEYRRTHSKIVIVDRRGGLPQLSNDELHQLLELDNTYALDVWTIVPDSEDHPINPRELCLTDTNEMRRASLLLLKNLGIDYIIIAAGQENPEYTDDETILITVG